MDLLIDDERRCCECIARTYDAGITVLGEIAIECLYIDFDLGEKKTGLDVLQWAYLHDVLPLRIQLVTMNPPGREQMGACLRECGYVSDDGVNFRKE